VLEFAHLVDLAFLPSVVLGIVFGITWRYVEAMRIRVALQWIASILFFVPQPFALYFGSYSSSLRLYQQVLLSLWGFGTGLLMTIQILSTNSFVRTTQKPRSKLVLALGAAAMLGLGVYCGWVTVGDYLLQHDIVSGTVEGARVVRHRRSPNTYQVIINHRAYGITRDLLAQMRPGDYIEGEVGIASGTILAVRREIPLRSAR
jgi:hypothetical protein